MDILCSVVPILRFLQCASTAESNQPHHLIIPNMPLHYNNPKFPIPFEVPTLTVSPNS